MKPIACEICGGGPQQGLSIYRTGGKGPGVDPHWRCEGHAKNIDPVTWNTVAAIEHAIDKGQT